MFLPHWRGGFPRPMRNSRALRVKCGIGRPGEGIPFRGSHVSPERLWSTWKPQTTIYKWLFQLDDFKPLHRKWLFHQTSTLNWFFGVSGTTLPPIINGKVHHPTPAKKNMLQNPCLEWPATPSSGKWKPAKLEDPSFYENTMAIS